MSQSQRGSDEDKDSETDKEIVRQIVRQMKTLTAAPILFLGGLL